MKQLRLRRVAFCALPLALSVGSGCATTPMTGGARNAAPRYSAKQFFDTTTVFGGSFSADESRILITSDASGVFNAFAQPVTSGEPIQLTDSTTNAVMGVSYFPRDDRILYTADQGGNERNHLFVRDPDGSTTDLTPGEDLKASFVPLERRQAVLLGADQRTRRELLRPLPVHHRRLLEAAHLHQQGRLGRFRRQQGRPVDRPDQDPQQRRQRCVHLGQQGSRCGPQAHHAAPG
jgi:hypothetical protein